jgi:hypothetical protein
MPITDPTLAIKVINGAFTKTIKDEAGAAAITILSTSVTIVPPLVASGAGITNLSASNLASGTVPDARFPATLPAVSGVNLTALNASNIASGNLPIAYMPTGAGTWALGGTLTLSGANVLLSRSTNGALSHTVENSNTGTAASSRFILQTGGSGESLLIDLFSSGFTPNNAIRPLWVGITASNQTNGLYIAARKAATNIELYTGGITSAELRATFSSAGLTLGQGLSVGTTLALVGIASATTVGAAGAGSALPATPEGYITVTIAGTARKIPYYLT